MSNLINVVKGDLLKGFDHLALHLEAIGNMTGLKDEFKSLSHEANGLYAKASKLLDGLSNED